MEAKKDILKRVYLVYVGLALFATAILGRVVWVQFVEGDEWRQKAEDLTTQYRKIEAVRGNVFASDGSLLATSIPIYEIRMDTKAVSDEVFDAKVDTLAIQLSRLFRDHSAFEYKTRLVEARRKGEQYFLIRRNVHYKELKQLRQFAIFNLGKYKGGFIYVQQNKRERPFRHLAARTIGYKNESAKPVGLEGAYNNELSGHTGMQLMQKLSGGVWMPIEDENAVEPEDGLDIVTTLDLNIQDVAENALMEQLAKHGADHGCVVLMEVSTGEIKAIANLGRDAQGNYYEKFNYAIGESTEPGSTFKLASYMIALEDGIIDLEDSIDTKDGKFNFYDNTMFDSHEGGFGKITIKHAFEVSSNIAVARIINENYGKNPSAFIEKLYRLKLNEPLGIEIFGEGKPQIKNVTDPSWSGISLPWISHGYEVSLTPLQILTFYNAVANNGVAVKPMFVKELRKRGKSVRKFDVQVLNESICSQKTIDKLKQMMEGVVEEGTAQNLKNPNYKIAGKTGTAQVGYADKSKSISYQASFCGYFPAENPRYSCIVVVQAPSRNVYYGNLVAGPIFKEISDKVFATSIDMHKTLPKPEEQLAAMPASKNGYQPDLKFVFETLDLAYVPTEETDWARTMAATDKIEMKKLRTQEGLVPDVTGMDAQDAVFMLENAGLHVRVIGRGVVKSQSIVPGSRTSNYKYITLMLS